jgi:hypothetical protein
VSPGRGSGRVARERPAARNCRHRSGAVDALGHSDPELERLRLLSRQDDAAAFDMIANLVRSVLPTIERFGLGRTAADLKV